MFGAWPGSVTRVCGTGRWACAGIRFKWLAKTWLGEGRRSAGCSAWPVVASDRENLGLRIGHKKAPVGEEVDGRFS